MWLVLCLFHRTSRDLIEILKKREGRKMNEGRVKRVSCQTKKLWRVICVFVVFQKKYRCFVGSQTLLSELRHDKGFLTEVAESFVFFGMEEIKAFAGISGLVCCYFDYGSLFDGSVGLEKTVKVKRTVGDGCVA